MSIFMIITMAMTLIMILLLVLEILTFNVLRDQYRERRLKLHIIAVANAALSIWLWYLLIRVASYKGHYDNPEHIWIRMNLTGMYCAVVAPRVLVCFFHYLGKLIKIKSRGHIRKLTRSGLFIASIIFTIIALSTFIGRFNFKTVEVCIRINGLPPGLEGLKIAQLSDLHLAGFHRHKNKLAEAMDIVNGHRPDLILNTGDFVSYGWREFDSCDTILVKAVSRYGNFAVIGNHDKGTYLPGSSAAERDSVFLMLNYLVSESGYRVLNDENLILNIRDSEVAVIGVETSGRHPGIIHGNVEKASEGTGSADLRILLIHDPNQWRKDVTGKTDIELSLAGHTHGMQIGILTKKFRWSPSKYYYPEWNGLYSEGNQHLYVNRGLGVLSIPFRIWMPPEITIITLESGTK